MSNKRSGRSVLGLVFLTIFIDMVGFSVLFPLFPDLLAHYLDAEGPGSLIGGLESTLQGWVGGREGAEFAVIALFGGVLGSLYSMLQFLFAPFWGGLSDRIGRRSTLLLTLGGTALSYLVWFFAGSFALLIVARILGGIMAGNIATASAVIADVSEPSKRVKNMAVVGIAIGLGFVLGPAVGALAYLHIDVLAWWPGGEALGVNPFSGAALAALVLALFNWLWAAVRFPETLPVERRGSSDGAERSRNPFAALARINLPGVTRTNITYLIYQTCFAAMEFTLVFLAADRFLYGPKENAWMFVFVGLTIAFIQGGVVRRLSGKVSEKKIAMAGITLMFPGLLAVGFSGSPNLLYFGLFFLAAGSALTFPSLSALISLYVPSTDQGLALGTFRSMGSLSRAIGPVLGGLAYWGLGTTAPYLMGALVLIVPLAMAATLPPIPEDESVSAT
ncbi:MFS transporter [Engelhardtia mirabilis]|uniref:Tetracycline resistance protein, class B n=1 Tax=Engelhardtia mirabilis TaxID=2528011 RepID=A0A518BM23_9BACT|nr:Tetracycline resistance protein, class B [Planctomycetes bacterium Pla133]QDV02355.1 Tetracycline resistance protein, class B [Planctomycetes bacterium Pla86]